MIEGLAGGVAAVDVDALGAGNGEAAWADAVLALTLFAVDPAGLGGISLRAGPGPVRDHWLSLLSEALPSGTPLCRIPLHAGDDRLLGGLDLAATLQAGRAVAQQGLLCEADGGVVLLAMAERVEVGTAARLCSALDQGAVTLQRDGLHNRLAARFGIVALDEGIGPEECPPASLLDRLAFHLDLTEIAVRDVGTRAWVDDDVSAARERLLSVAGQDFPGEALYGGALSGRDRSGHDAGEKGDDAVDAAEILCSAASALGIGSIRAPLLALRVARVAAALAGRDEVTEADLGLAVRLVFVSRAIRFPQPQDAEAPSDAGPAPDPDGSEPESEMLGETPLAEVVLDAVRAVLPPDLLDRLASMEAGRGGVRVPGRSGQTKVSVKRGRPIGIRQGEPKNGSRLHLLETLKAAAPWQTLRRRTAGGDASRPKMIVSDAGQLSATPPRFEVRREDFRVVRFRQRIGTTTVFAVDASGSAAMNRLGEAKGAVELLLADCYVRRDQVALLAFRGQGATLLLPPTGSLLRAKRSLAGLPGGGPTPLAAGIDAAMALADTVRRAGRTPVITLLTDARANVARDGTGGRPRAEAEAIESARALGGTGVATLLVDTSPRPNPFARRLAEAMRAHYVPLPYADAQALSQAVRSAAAA